MPCVGKLSVVVAATGVTFLLEGCGSGAEKKWKIDCGDDCTARLECEETGAVVTRGDCDNADYLTDMVGKSMADCMAWIKSHSSDAEKKTQCAVAAAGRKEEYLADCGKGCFVTFECTEKGMTVIGGDGCDQNKAPWQKQVKFDECKDEYENFGNDWGSRTSFCKEWRGNAEEDDVNSGKFHLPCGAPPKGCVLDVSCTGTDGLVAKNCAGSPSDLQRMFPNENACKTKVKDMHDNKITRDAICGILTKAETTTTTTAVATTLVQTTPAPPPPKMDVAISI